MTQSPAVIRGRADIEAIEAAPYDEWAGARSTWDLLENAARHAPDQPALVFATRPDSFDSILTYSFDRLVTDVRRAAGVFRSLGIGRGDRVALLAPNIPSAHVAMWGAQLAGCAFPINYLLKAEHVSDLLRASGARVVVALDGTPELAIRDAALDAVARVDSVEHVLLIDPEEASPAVGSFQRRVAAASDAWDERPRSDDLAALYHTGGTTGTPKLLRHTHRNEVHTSRAAATFYDFGRGDRMLNGFPLFHVAGAFVYGLSCLAAGGSLFLPTLTGMRNNAFVRRAWTWLDRAKVTHIGAVPTTLAALLDAPRDAGEAPTVRVAMTGGSPLPNELANRFEQRFRMPVRNIFGMTECAGIVSIEPVDAERRPSCVGYRLPYSQVVAVPLDDARRSRLERFCRAGETGVIAIRGPHVSGGYLDPARNAGTFTDDGWLLSGDLGYVDEDGRIFLTGRAKDLIIRSSHNLDPAAIEDAFIAHPAVTACAAVGEPDAYAGELPVVFVTLKPGTTLSGDALLAEVRPAIAEPPAVPKRVTVLDQMPLTAIGKIYKPALRALAARRKVVDLATMAADGQDVEVDAVDTVSGVTITVRLGAAGDDALRQRVRDALADLSLEVRVVARAGAAT